MDAATATSAAPGPPLRARSAGARHAGRRSRKPTATAAGRELHRPLLAVLLLVCLLVRLWGIGQGMPYSYNVDEATHFVPRAIAFFSHDLNPNYFLNPPGYSYLLHIVFELWFGSSDRVLRAAAVDPTSVYVVARVVAAVLGTVAAGLTYLAGARFFGRSVGLLAGAMLGLAFLPVFYSHLALNDVPALAPLALSLVGVAGVWRRGRLRDYALAGVGIGLAAATKYTGGITLVCLVGATICDAAGAGRLQAARKLGAGLLLALAAFLIANPYALLDPSGFFAGLSSQASLAGGANPVKLGSTAGGGVGYYLWTFTWGLGWGPALAGLGGAVLLVARRRAALALVLLPAPVIFVLFMGSEQRYFGRWLMPIFPIVVILAGYAAIELVRWLSRTTGLPRSFLLGLAAVLLLAQSAIAVVHDDEVLSRPDTRNLTRAWMVAHIPAGAKVVIEPVVPDNWASDVGRSLAWTPSGDRWYRFATWLSDVDQNGNLLPAGQRRYVLVDEYERTLRPELLSEYVKSGYCWVVVGSLQAGRAFENPRAAPQAVAYYAALAREARLVYHVTPFSAGAQAVPFNFDWSIDYLPRQYHLPGPEMSVYRLSGGRCASGIS